MMSSLSISFLLIATLYLVKAEFTDLENFIRVLGSLNSTQETINYINGSVFGKQPGKDLQKIFNFEGYNIRRIVPKQDGTFYSLSRELVVYRQPETAQIMQVWVNPWTNRSNEVFHVANDPVNGNIGIPLPVQKLSRHKLDTVVYNADYVIQYPNPLTPEKYANYSAGPIYKSVESFGFFANHTCLYFSQDTSVPVSGIWIRKSQYLPWMEMTTTPGELYFSTFFWKCDDGLSCVADDIMELIKLNYPKFQHAPTQDEEPNETSWTVFKKVIDQRRLAGLPDIIIPEVNASNVQTMTYNVDDRVLEVLSSRPLELVAKGSAWSEILGNQSIRLFDINGNLVTRFELAKLPNQDGFRVQFDGVLSLSYPETGRPLTQNYMNPITGKTNKLLSRQVSMNMVFTNESFYTMDIPSSKAVGLLGAQSIVKASGEWSVNLINLVFPNSELNKQEPQSSHFYGTFASFSSWPTWMEMGDSPGNIIMKLTVSK